MPLDLTRSVAVITGAGSGIGQATAHAFADEARQVVVTDLDEERASTVADEIGDASRCRPLRRHERRRPQRRA